jgi:hypothetical protein
MQVSLSLVPDRNKNVAKNTMNEFHIKRLLRIILHENNYVASCIEELKLLPLLNEELNPPPAHPLWLISATILKRYR